MFWEIVLISQSSGYTFKKSGTIRLVIVGVGLRSLIKNDN